MADAADKHSSRRSLSDSDGRTAAVVAPSETLADTDHEESPVSSAELEQLRGEKLAAIRQAIAAGAYDSEELLFRAMERMIDRLEESAETSHTSLGQNAADDA
ncbi:MAG: hypothetical protein KDA85_11155, partial [Planctomycetaceae bacterium]|nr:hypothetical protein [Planctomycetaceae bacterium]